MLLFWVCRVALEHQNRQVKLTREQYERNNFFFGPVKTHQHVETLHACS